MLFQHVAYAQAVPADDLRGRYLDCLRRALIGTSASYPYRFLVRPPAGHEDMVAELNRRGVELVTRREGKLSQYEVGAGWPLTGQTMIGERRLKQLQEAVETVISEGVAGDLIETGVWRGGAAILMRGVLHAHEVEDRQVWVADSFEGLPPPDRERYPADRDRPYVQPVLEVSLDEVRTNFASYDLLDERVRFLPGWFRDTLPPLRGHVWAVVRLDGDMYESTIQALESLYPSLSPGGFLIVDDYGALAECRLAVDDFRTANAVNEPIEAIDHAGVFWRKR
jgi:O-methyltransferase